MDWNEQRKIFRIAVEEVAALLNGATDLSVPGLGTWDLRGLAGHFLRAVRTPLEYLRQPIPEGAPLPSAAAYVTSYLEWRTANPAQADAAVAARGVAELEGVSSSPGDAIRSAAADLDDELLQQQPTRLVPTRFGPMRLSDYLRTRGMEVTIHGLDIARAIDATWTPPTPILADTVALLSEVALMTGTASELLLVLSGRISPEEAKTLPLLR